MTFRWISGIFFYEYRMHYHLHRRRDFSGGFLFGGCNFNLLSPLPCYTIGETPINGDDVCFRERIRAGGRFKVRVKYRGIYVSLPGTFWWIYQSKEISPIGRLLCHSVDRCSPACWHASPFRFARAPERSTHRRCRKTARHSRLILPIISLSQ